MTDVAVAVRHAVSIRIENDPDTVVELEGDAVLTLRTTLVAELLEANERLVDAFGVLGAFGSATARDELERVGHALDECRHLTSALWYLAPMTVPADEVDS